MARHNYVNVIAFVLREPILKETLDGKDGIAAFVTIMSPRDVFKAKTGYQCHSVNFCVRSNDERILNIMKDFKKFDLVEINGYLATKDIDKKVKCPFCDAMNSRQDSCVANGRDMSGGNMTFVYPMSLQLLAHCKDEQDAYEHLHNIKDDVNRVFVIGNLTNDPVNGELQGGSKIYTRYQIAVSRKYRGKGALAGHERVDYPWVYSYQSKAEKDFETLKSGALVFVDGALQSRKFKEQYECWSCGKEFDASGKTLEILAYDTEYLRLPEFEGLESYPNLNPDEYDSDNELFPNNVPEDTQGG